MKVRHEKFMSLFFKDESLYRTLFTELESFSSFEYRVNKISKDKAVYFGYDEGEIGSNKMKGDIFEIFIEIFLHLCGSHSTICISSYRPIDGSEDNGVDGIGLCQKSNPLTVQVKFRTEIDYELVSSDLKQFWGQSIVKYNVDKDVKGNMVIVTNCKGVNWYTLKEVLLEKARVIGRNDIITIIKSNNCYWDNLKTIINNSLKENLGSEYEYKWERV